MSRPSRRCIPMARPVAGAALVLLTFLNVPSASSQVVRQSRWAAGGTGFWNTAAAWSPAGVPNNNASFLYHVRVDSSAAAVNVGTNGNFTIDRLRVDAGDTVTVQNGTRLTLSAANGAGVIENQGTISLGGTGSNTYLHCETGPVTLTGGGEVILSNAPNNYMYKSDASGSWVNQDNTIRGGGFFGWSGSPTAITNHGTVIADLPTPLNVQPSTPGMTNDGTMRATAGATLVLGSGGYANAGGVIEAENASLVSLAGGASISGGTLQTSGTGAVQSISVSAARLTGVTNLGSIVVLNGTRIDLAGTIVNQGTISLGGTGSNTYLQCANGPVTLTGGGEVILSNAPNNYMYKSDASGSWVNQDNTIRGAGFFGWSGSPTPITNHGMVIADQPTLLTVDAGSQPFSSDGTMRVAPGSQMRVNTVPANLSSGTFTGGTWEAIGGVMRLVGTNIVTNAATILLDGAGAAMYNSAAGSVSVFAGLAANAAGGSLTIRNGATVTSGASIVSQGDIVLDAGTLGCAGTVTVAADTLRGTGTVAADLVNAGDVVVGSSVGTIHVSGDFEQTATGDIHFEMGGTAAGQSDLLQIDGHATLDGDIDYVLANGYVPALGDSVTIATFASRTGTFNAHTGGDLGGGLYFRPVYQATRLVLVVESGVLGADVIDLPSTFALTARPVMDAPVLDLDLPHSASVSLHLYDVTGREVAAIRAAARPAGRHALAVGGRLSSGVYFARAVVRGDAKTHVLTARAVILR